MKQEIVANTPSTYNPGHSPHFNFNNTPERQPHSVLYNLTPKELSPLFGIHLIPFLGAFSNDVYHESTCSQ